ncbi:zinc-finger of the MIZ type in Nse subunit-domain-containing protein [Peziza echinospora]|nr:zinc-finger of the MIZ type in Nse subunit-domain-containing protein [Peziza echinospora]
MPPRRHLQKSATASSSRTATNERTSSGSNVARFQYQPPSHLPLNAAPGRQLQALAANSASENSAIRKNIQDALKILTDAAGDLAERVPPVDVGRTVKQTPEDEDEDEDGQDATDRKAHGFLQEMDCAARGMVDRAWEVDVAGEIMRQEVIAAGMTGENGDEEGGTASRLRKGLWGVYSSTLGELKEERAETSMKDRYASVGEYMEFRRVIWESQHAGEPMPPTKQWFPEEKQRSQNAAASQSGTAPDRDAQDDSDSDIELQSTKTSDVCPLTLRPFQEPYTSTKCPHSFEKSAIFELINKAEDWRPVNAEGAGMNVRNPNPNGYERCVRCPTPGCMLWLSSRNLKEDRIIVRRMRMEKERRERQEMEQLLDNANGKGKGRPGQAGGGNVGDESFVDADALYEGEGADVESVKKEKRWAGKESEPMDVDEDEDEDDY